MNELARGFDSRAIHAGQEPDPATGAVIPPVHFSTTFVQDGIGSLREGYEYGRSGNPTRTADLTRPETLDAALREGTPRVVWVETPSNPLLQITDIARVAEAAHAVGALVVVDNTFATPALQLPLALGADVVVHSATKYLGGHSDVVGGALVTTDEEVYEQAKFLQFAAGAVSGPLDAWLTTRGIKTLGIRMQRHSASAQTIAETLAADSRVHRVLYPGLADHPGHDIAARQMSGFGGIVSIEFGTGVQARRFAESTRLFTLAESLGGVESLVNHPEQMTHASVRGTPLGVSDTIVRLSVGIESVEDLLDDLDRAVAAAV